AVIAECHRARVERVARAGKAHGLLAAALTFGRGRDGDIRARGSQGIGHQRNLRELRRTETVAILQGGSRGYGGVAAGDLRYDILFAQTIDERDVVHVRVRVGIVSIGDLVGDNHIAV